MSASVSISSHENKPGAYIVTCEDGRRFIVFMLDPSVSIYIYGFDAQALETARSIAACMTAVAGELEMSLAAVPPVVQVPAIDEEVMF